MKFDKMKLYRCICIVKSYDWYHGNHFWMGDASFVDDMCCLHAHNSHYYFLSHLCNHYFDQIVFQKYLCIIWVSITFF